MDYSTLSAITAFIVFGAAVCYICPLYRHRLAVKDRREMEQQSQKLCGRIRELARQGKQSGPLTVFCCSQVPEVTLEGYIQRHHHTHVSLPGRDGACHELPFSRLGVDLHHPTERAPSRADGIHAGAQTQPRQTILQLLDSEVRGHSTKPHEPHRDSHARVTRQPALCPADLQGTFSG